MDGFRQRITALEDSLEKNDARLEQDFEQLKVDFGQAFPKGDLSQLLSARLRDALAHFSGNSARCHSLDSVKASLCDKWGITRDELDATFDDYASTDFFGELRKIATRIDWSTAVRHLTTERNLRQNAEMHGMGGNKPWQLGDAKRVWQKVEIQKRKRAEQDVSSAASPASSSPHTRLSLGEYLSSPHRTPDVPAPRSSSLDPEVTHHCTTPTSALPGIPNLDLDDTGLHWKSDGHEGRAAPTLDVGDDIEMSRELHLPNSQSQAQDVPGIPSTSQIEPGNQKNDDSDEDHFLPVISSDTAQSDESGVIGAGELFVKEDLHSEDRQPATPPVTASRHTGNRVTFALIASSPILRRPAMAPQLPESKETTSSGIYYDGTEGPAKNELIDGDDPRDLISIEEVFGGRYKLRFVTPDEAELILHGPYEWPEDQQITETLLLLRSGACMNADFTNEVVRMVATIDPTCYVIDPDRITLKEAKRVKSSSLVVRFLLIPVYFDQHWILAKCVPSEKEVHLFDSMACATPASQAVQQLDPFLKAIVGGDWHFTNRSCPQQDNDTDCGIYVAALAMYIVTSHDAPHMFHGQFWRQLFARFIADNVVDDVNAEGQDVSVPHHEPALETDAPMSMNTFLEAAENYRRYVYRTLKAAKNAYEQQIQTSQIIIANASDALSMMAKWESNRLAATHEFHGAVATMWDCLEKFAGARPLVNQAPQERLPATPAGRAREVRRLKVAIMLQTTLQLRSKTIVAFAEGVLKHERKRLEDVCLKLDDFKNRLKVWETKG